MRYLRPIFVAAALLVVASTASAPARAGVSFDFFYSNLSPHGSWHVSAQYGRVWQPYAYRPGWNPYYDGHWVYTDVGCTWVSDYRWGAVPYHYGTWVPDPVYGWVWVPGYVWAPSWVVFRTGPDYIGWAPVAPGFSVSVSFGTGGSVVAPYVFVPSRYFLAPRVGGYAVPASHSRVIVRNTMVVNTLVVERNVVVNRGPDVRIVERASGRRVKPVRLEQVERVAPGRGVDRREIAVDSRRASRGLRAAEPVSRHTPLPAGELGDDRPRRGRVVEPRPERRQGEVRQPDKKGTDVRQPDRRGDVRPPERRGDVQRQPEKKGAEARPRQERSNDPSRKSGDVKKPRQEELQGQPGKSGKDKKGGKKGTSEKDQKSKDGKGNKDPKDERGGGSLNDGR